MTKLCQTRLRSAISTDRQGKLSVYYFLLQTQFIFAEGTIPKLFVYTKTFKLVIRQAVTNAMYCQIYLLKEAQIVAIDQLRQFED